MFLGLWISILGRIGRFTRRRRDGAAIGGERRRGGGRDAAMQDAKG